MGKVQEPRERAGGMTRTVALIAFTVVMFYAGWALAAIR